MANELDIFRGFPTEFRDLFGTSRRLNRFFDDFFTKLPQEAGLARGVAQLVPTTELKETDEHYILSCEMPGVPKENINIEVRGNRLHISGERRAEVKGKEGEETRGVYGRYEQIVTLPADVDPSSVEAEYKDGVLYIAIPKSETRKATKIEVSSGEKGILSKLKTKVAEAMGGKSEDKAENAA